MHLSRDGELVVVHDGEVRVNSATRSAIVSASSWSCVTKIAVIPTSFLQALVPVNGVTSPVASLVAAELARLPLGLGQGVPRLGEVLALARGRIGVYVELKGPRTGAALGRLMASGGAVGVEVISGSFEPSLVDELRAAAPAVPRSVLFRPTETAAMLATCAAVGATYAHPCFRPLTPAIVDALHAAGLLVMAPHTNDPEEARAFAGLGIDVLASDDPRVLRPP